MEKEAKTNTSNYDLQVDIGRRIFLEYDSESLVCKWGLTADEMWIYLTYLNVPCRIHREDGRIEELIDGSWNECRSFSTVMTIYDMLCYHKGTVPPVLCGRWCPVGEFVVTGVQNTVPFTRKYATLFQKQKEKLRGACLRLGGELQPPMAGADITCKFQVTKFFSLLLQFWEGDEEFAPQLMLLWDRNTTCFMHFETTFYLQGDLLERISAQLENRRCLLVGINAKYIHLNSAIYSLKYSVPETLRSSVEIAEYTINHVYEQILMDIFRRKPDMVGISCYIWNMSVVKRLCKDLAKVLPGVPIWLGGPEAAHAGDELFDELPITGVMFGEGEVVFPKLLAAWTDGTDLETVPGLRFRSTMRGVSPDCEFSAGDALPAERVIATADPPLADMDELPFLYDKEIDFDHRIIYYESSRGCPYRCSYCLSAIEKIMRYRSLDLVLSELQWFLDRRVPQVKFLDRTFNSNRDRTLAIWRYILEHDNGVTNFHFEVTADLMSQAEIELLRNMRPGLVQLEIGVQTTNPMTLEAINRRADMDRLKQVTEAIRQGENVHQHLDLIAGLPFEDIDSFANSFNAVYRMQPSQLQLGFLKVLKGSPIASQVREFGLVYRDEPPYEVLHTAWLTYEDIVRLKGIEEMVETYYNSHQFELTVQALVRKFDSPFAFYDALAVFAKKENPEGRSLSRMALFEQMQRFIYEFFGKCKEVFDTLLTMDYYLRDNARNRPPFAVGRELPKSMCGRDWHVEEISFDLERFLCDGTVFDQVERWSFDYSERCAISGNARLRKENIPI